MTSFNAVLNVIAVSIFLGNVWCVICTLTLRGFLTCYNSFGLTSNTTHNSCTYQLKSSPGAVACAGAHGYWRHRQSSSCSSQMNDILLPDGLGSAIRPGALKADWFTLWNIFIMWGLISQQGNRAPENLRRKNGVKLTKLQKGAQLGWLWWMAPGSKEIYHTDKAPLFWLKQSQ